MKAPPSDTDLALTRPKMSSKLQPLDLVRLALVVGIIGVWVVASLSFLIGAYIGGGRMTFEGLAFPTGQAANGQSVISMLASIPGHCPTDRPFLMLNEDVTAYRYTDYILYPAKTVPVFRETPFGQAELDASRGGCVVTMDAYSAARIEPFRDQLTEITCVAEACLYRINP